MTNYDFSTLNSTDLEELVCDLLNSELYKDTVFYRTFKEGKDKGIDFLNSTEDDDYNHVGQVKHFYRSGFKALKTVLTKSEYKKVKKLNPNKYILATSVDLGVNDTEVIKEIMTPYIKSLKDIYGKNDLNKLIAKHDNVHESHFKLWFSNTYTFQKLLNSNLAYRSIDFTEKAIKKRIALYVLTKSFSDARLHLRNNNHIVITGEPGIGKTSLAEMLIYEYIKDGFELLYVYDSIREADDALTEDSKKQVIYFDDFLGSNEIEINKARGSDTFLNKVLRRVKQNRNKVLIFTTRKHILSRALLESEKLKRFNILSSEKVLKLDDYKHDIRSQILINHIELSQLPEQLKQVLKSKDIFNFIVQHEHFSPRSIEYITSKDSFSDASKFKTFIRESFDNPSEIWQFAYTNQLKDDDRILLNTLLSFCEEVTNNKLKKAFDSRIDYEVLHNNKSRVIHAYQNSYKRLIGSFIYSDHGENIRFINHSLLDFLFKYVRSDPSEVEKIISSIVSVEQLTKRLFPLKGSNLNVMPSNLKRRLLESYHSFLSENYDDKELIVLAIVIYKYIPIDEATETVEDILLSIENWQQFYEDYELSESFRGFLTEVSSNQRLYGIIAELVLEILNELVTSEHDYDKAIEILDNLMLHYKIDLFQVDTTTLNDHFNIILEEELDSEIDFLTHNIYDESQVDELKKQVEIKIEALQDLGIECEIDFRELYRYDWYELALDNYISDQMLKDD